MFRLLPSRGKSIIHTRLFAAAALLAVAIPSDARAGLTGEIRSGRGGSPFVIDSFTDSVAAGWPLTVNASVSDHALSEPLTGNMNRAATLQRTFMGTSLDAATATIAPDVSGGALDYVSSVHGAANLRLEYEHSDASAFDLSGYNGIEIDFLGFDFPAEGPLRILLSLTSGGDTVSTAVMLANNSPATVFIGFGGLSQREIGLFDFENVSNIALDFDAAAGSDFRIGEIRATAVPAPGALALLGASALLSRRRRRCD